MWSVSSPFKMIQALKAESVAPVVRRNLKISSDSALLAVVAQFLEHFPEQADPVRRLQVIDHCACFRL